MAPPMSASTELYKNAKECVPEGDTPVQNFYRGSNVFITGGTGFMGKILIEKLLRSTQVETIYILIRQKRGKDVHTRLEELFEDVIFQRLKSESIRYKHRVSAIPGDCSISGLGLGITDRKTLISNVHIVFHAAATVRFDENLKLAFAINVNGTRDVLDLAREMKNLKSIVHVSTAYANCHLSRIEEKFYDYPVNYGSLEQILEKVDSKSAEEITPKILGNWPNTYTFTKAMAENLIKDSCNGLPIGVYRPAIIVSTYSEPIPYWIDNLYGPTGVCAGVASGLLRTLNCDKNVIANIVPVDKCIAGIIVAAWDVYQRKCERVPENVPIYNNVSSVDNPVNWGEFTTINTIYGKKYPLSNLTWAICFDCTPNKTVNYVKKVFYHYVPAIVFDAVTLVIGQKPRLLKMYKKIHKFSEVIEYFCTRDWDFANDNMKILWKRMDERDREIFPFDIKTVLWLNYFRSYIKGIREYLLKDPPETMPSAKKRQKMFVIAHNTFKICLYFLTFSVLWNIFRKLYQVAINRSITYSPL